MFFISFTTLALRCELQNTTGGVDPPENTKLENKHVERPVKRGKLVSKDSNTIIVWLLLKRSTS